MVGDIRGKGGGKPGGRKKPLTLFDRLVKESQEEGKSMWKGDRGIYVFESTGEVGSRKPIRKVYLNRAYLTGLFPSRKADQYTGDIKEVDRKVYLLFKVSGADSMEIYSR